jgi:hypothetical protein
MADILIGDDQLVRAFALWDRKFRSDPRGFKSDIERVLNGETPEEYGVACGQYFKALLIEAR